MNFALFGRFFLEFAMMYPAEYLCLASLQEHLRAPRKTYAIGASAITLMGLAGAAVCCMLDMETNFLLIPLLIISFWLLRWRTDREVSISQTMFLFSVSAVMMSVCTLLAVVLNAEAELDNAQPVFLPSTSVICLTLAVILSTIFRFTAVRWSRWLLQEYHGEAFWESAWPLPALYAAFLVFCMPKEIGIILMNRIRIIAVLAVSISLLGIFLLLYEMYRVAKEYARSSQLDRENQLLAVESRHYMELRGIGVIDVRRLFGMGAIKLKQQIDMVINLEPWNDNTVYDRLGLDQMQTEVLGVKLPSITIPVKPGRNLASIVEVAAMNNRNRKMGHNAALELTQRMDRHFEQNGLGDELDEED